MEYYSARRKNETMWFEGKWMAFENIMLSDIREVQKEKGCVFSLICGRHIQKIHVYTKVNMIIYILICRTCL
jgi:hypothetical protein